MDWLAFDWLVDYYQNSNLKLRLLFISIIVLIFLCVAVLLILIFLRMKLYKRRNKKKNLKTIYEELIITLLYLDPEGPGYEEERDDIFYELKYAVKSRTERNILNEILINLHRDIAGDMAIRIQDIFHELGLVAYALKKLKSSKWYIKIQGIRELTQIEERSIQEEVLKLVDHKNALLRNEAQLTILRLFEYKGLLFLKDLQYPISEWQQLQLMAVIQKNPALITNQLSHLLESKNVTVVQFTLKLIHLFNQMIDPEKLKILVKHKNVWIRIKAVELISELGYFDLKPFLKNQYHFLGKSEKLAVVKVFSYLGTEEDLEFLIERSEENDFKISYNALLVMKDVLSVDLFKDKMKTVQVKNRDVYNYIMKQVG